MKILYMCASCLIFLKKNLETIFGRCVCHSTCVVVQEQLGGVGFPFFRVDPGGTELVSLASKHLYPLSLFAGPNA